MKPDDDDDSIGAFWRDVKASRQQKRADNRVSSAEHLRKAGIPFETKNFDAHLIVRPTNGKVVIDFWPGTGRWIVRNNSLKGFGVTKLLDFCRHAGRGNPV